MSCHVEALCDRRRFGSAACKQIAMYLSNKASDDGAGNWWSKHIMARHTDLNLATVKRTFRDFLDEGLCVETGDRGACDHGHTVVDPWSTKLLPDWSRCCPKGGPKSPGTQ
ncbi:hypothetical protein EKE94_05490 [Mesobaculum littorinae]|uniref:Helix-turn-helix domain-containing protein n=1 Tax=Mesobaculum littorinae TaxID=2486419 RepID=A0A438AIF7_9RHOB|nr:hypothetical protein [Mesobaculum littorinae]RVV98377.1 hypothetical protein EKE94_05490 [Mesobaculum littorinae]